MEKISRREFLKIATLSVSSLASIPYISPERIDVDTDMETLGTFSTSVEIVGPKLELRTNSECSPGDRSIYFDESDSNIGIVGVQQGQPGECYMTNDGGATWKKVMVPVSTRYYTYLPSPRHIKRVDDNRVLAVFDYSVALGTKNEEGYFDFKNIYPEGLEDDRIIQLVCPLPNGRVLLGGYDMLQGIFTSTMSQIEATLDFNKKNSKRPRMFKWSYIPGLESPWGSYIRSIAYDPVYNMVLYGGWRGSPVGRPGIGVHCLDADTLKPVLNHPYICEDSLGPNAVNMIKVFYHNGHQVVVVGNERGDIDVDGKTKNSDGVLKIFIDGVRVSGEKVNTKKLVKETGGIDIVSCASGVEVITHEDQTLLVVSSFSEHLSAVNVDELFDNSSVGLNWQRITTTPKGARSFGAAHIGKTKDRNGNAIIYSGRLVYGSTKYQPAAFVKFK